MLIHIIRRKDNNDSLILQYTVWFLLLLLILFASIVYISPDVSMAGLGTSLVIMGVLVEFNSKRIWGEYLKQAKKRKKKLSAWQQPNEIFYKINVYLLWPLVIFMGVLSIWVAYMLSALTTV